MWPFKARKVDCACDLCTGVSRYTTPMPVGTYPKNPVLAAKLKRIDAITMKAAHAMGMRHVPERGTIEGDTSYYTHGGKQIFYAEDALKYAPTPVIDWLTVHENTHAAEDQLGKKMNRHWLREAAASKIADDFIQTGEIGAPPKTAVGSLMTRIRHRTTMSKPVARQLGVSAATVSMAHTGCASGAKCGNCLGRHIDEL